MAALILLAALAWDLWPEATEAYPVAAVDLAAGDTVDEAAVRHEPLPRGLLPQPARGSVVLVAVPAGTPLVPGLVGEVVVPDGWWTVSVDVPDGAVAGSDVRVAITSVGGAEAVLVPGIVVSGPTGTGLDRSPGGVAVPEGHAAAVAAAVGSGRVTVLTGTP